jgi:tetratricopeptide (TPR) repeat protein
VDHVRLFRQHPDLRWEYRVHEQIVGSLRRLGTAIRPADVVIHHTGYQDPAHRPGKVERDLRLLRLEDRERPDDPFVLFNLGSLSSEQGRPAEALALFRRSLKRCGPTDSIVRKLYALIVYCHRELGRHKEALDTCREGLRCCPDDVELLYTEARLLHDCGDPAGAATSLEKLLRTPPADYFASVDPTLRGPKARLMLGLVYRDLDRSDEAEAQWRAALEEQPTFGPARLELGQFYLVHRRWEELEHTVRHLDTDPRWSQDALLLRARGHLARQEFAAARRLVEEAIARAPEAAYPRQLLSQVLLQEGRDWIAAEKALRAVLACDPQNAEARNNLGILLRQLSGASIKSATTT